MMGFIGVFGKSKSDKEPALSEPALSSKGHEKEQPYAGLAVKDQETLQKDARNLEIIEQIKQVVDPEINMDIWTLGMIYDIQQTGDIVKIILTLTSPMCPFGPQIMEELKSRIEKLGKKPELELVFSPAWKPSEELRELLGV